MDMDNNFSVIDQYEILEKMLKKAQEEKAIDLGKSYEIAMESIVDDLIRNAKFRYNDSGEEWSETGGIWSWEEFQVESKIVIDPQTKSILSAFWSNESYEEEVGEDFETNLVIELEELGIINKIAEQGKEGSESEIQEKNIGMQGSLLYIEFVLVNNFSGSDEKDRINN